MSTTLTVLIIAGVVVLLLAIFQRKNLSRILSAISGQFTKFSKMLWKADPVAVYQAQVDNSAEEINQATLGLEEYRGHVAATERKVELAQKEVNRLTAMIKVALQKNDESRAADLAVQLKREETDLQKYKEDLSGYRESYNNNLKKVRFARQKIEDAKDKARKLSAELKMSKAEAETAKLAEKFNVRTNTLDGLGEIEDEIQRQIDVNRGKAQVARDLSTDGLAEIEYEEQQKKNEAAEVLDRIRADMKK